MDVCGMGGARSLWTRPGLGCYPHSKGFFSIAGIFLEEDNILAFDYNGEQDLISDFLNAYDAADKTSKRAVSKLIENALDESDCFSLASAIADTAINRKNWSKKSR